MLRMILSLVVLAAATITLVGCHAEADVGHDSTHVGLTH